MQLQLPPHLDEMVREKVASGEYPNAVDVVAEALELLQQRDKLVRLRAAVQLGLDQADRGELIRYTPELHDRIIESARERWRAGDQPGPDVVP